MSRPKGSLNRKFKKDNIKRKRGRPRNPVVPPELPVPPVNTKRSKFLGYCPKCNAMIIKLDLESKFVFMCPYCGKRARISTLKKEIKMEKFTSKKEYIDHVINSDHVEAIPLNDHEIDPKDLKVQE